MIRSITVGILVLALGSTLEAEVVKKYFKDGKTLKSITTYKDGTLSKIGKGVKHGKEKVYYVNGKVAYEVNYVDGKRDGAFRWYEEENGALVKNVHYKMGHFHGSDKTYYPDGTLEHEVNYEDDKKVGWQKDYYSTGQLAIIVKYVNGKKEGIQKRYNQDGTLYSEVFYKNNFKEGKEKIYDKNGKLLKAERHKLDRPIDIMKRVQAKKPDATKEAFKGMNFNPKEHKMH
jgi:antitoxin component YwqK of YwqJK toxin-antitoxin module